MSLMARVDRARSTLQAANEQLSGARDSRSYFSGNEIVWREINKQINEKLLEPLGDVGKGAGEVVKEELSGLWDAITNPIETAKDTWAGLQEAWDDPIGAAKEAWNDFTEPYVEDWENGRQGEAIGRGLVEGGQMLIPGWNVFKGGKTALDILGGLGKDGDAPEAPNDPGGSDGGEPEDTPSGDNGSSNDDSDLDKDDGTGNEESDSDKSDKIVPSGQEGDAPSGTPTRIHPNERDPNNIRALTRENESAVTLANAGYKVEQNPNVEGSRKPDYKIEGKIADCYAPSTQKARNIASFIEDKITGNQADRIILNLDDSNVKLNDLKQQLTNYPVSGLKEIIVLKNGKVTPFFP